MQASCGLRQPLISGVSCAVVSCSVSRYRTRDEMVAWRARDPVVRFRNWIISNGWWDEEQERELRHKTRQQVGGFGEVQGNS